MVTKPNRVNVTVLLHYTFIYMLNRISYALVYMLLHDSHGQTEQEKREQCPLLADSCYNQLSERLM